MKVLNHKSIFSLIIFAILSFSACTESTTETTAVQEPEAKKEVATEFTVEAENFVQFQGDLTKTDDHIISNGDESWISFDINVPAAGRYKVELNAASGSAEASAWIEDYIDNKDGRTYNITGKMDVANAESFAISTIDGSPLNKGPHKIKIHIKGANTKVDGVKFSLIKAHQLTPKVLTQKTDGEEWKVVWSDEFDGSGIPDTSKWTFDIGNWGWGNNELQYYTEARPENARVEDGNLIIEARKDDMGQDWTSARLTTRGKVTFVYGRIEFRAKVPPKRGNWAAGWTLGDKYVDEISWPYCGEIDIMESVGYEMDDATGNGKAHASVHCGAYYFKLGNHHTGTVDVENLNNDFHIYAVDWTPEGIVASVDGKEYFTYDDTSSQLAWPFGEPQNIILNLAMGGGWGGAQGMDDTMTSQKMIIDYVRVYEK